MVAMLASVGWFQDHRPRIPQAENGYIAAFSVHGAILYLTPNEYWFVTLLPLAGKLGTSE